MFVPTETADSFADGEVTNPAHVASIFSFFSGCGLLDLGFESEGFQIEFVNESHKPFLDAYKFARDQPDLISSLGLSHIKPVYSNRSIEDFVVNPNEDSLLKKFNSVKSRGDRKVGFIGGPPCPDFSIGGKNKGEKGENGKLTATYVDLICNLKPDFFILENVKGLLRTKKHKAFFEGQIKKLRSHGFIVKFELLNSLSFEVPQDRERVIVFGMNKNTSNNAKKAIDKHHWPIMYNGEAVRRMPWPIMNEFQERGVLSPPNNVPLHLTVEHWFNKNAVESHPNSKHHFTPRAALPKFESVKEGDTNKKSYKRPHRWRYSPTAAYGNNEVHLHPWLARRLSAAEALSIQSVPREFQLPPDMSLSNMFKTIGNAVPYLMAKGIAKGCRSAFEI